jgi:hypothetical protein
MTDMFKGFALVGKLVVRMRYIVQGFLEEHPAESRELLRCEGTLG